MIDQPGDSDYAYPHQRSGTLEDHPPQHVHEAVEQWGRLDIVQRLRAHCRCVHRGETRIYTCVRCEAAECIEQLREKGEHVAEHGDAAGVQEGPDEQTCSRDCYSIVNYAGEVVGVVHYDAPTCEGVAIRNDAGEVVAFVAH